MSDRKSIASLLTDEQKEGWFETNIVANAPLIIGLFSNLVVIFADYRAYDEPIVTGKQIGRAHV